MNRHIQCRICASTDASLDLVNIFDDYETEECIADILLELAGIKATVDDGFPRNCCTQCHSDLTSAVSVRRKCIESEKLFQEALNCSSPLIDDQSDNASMVSLKQEQIPNYHCNECSIDFYNTESLKEHYESMHANVIHGWKSFVISEISLFDTTDDEVDEIVATESESKPVNSSSKIHYCCGCFLTFSTDIELKQHSDTVHASTVMQFDGDRAFQCNICYGLFTSASTLKHHQNMKIVKRYQCATCGILFRSPWQLNRHEFKHMPDAKLTCDVCNKIFSSPECLNAHMYKFHTQSKASKSQQKHVCDQCGKTVNSAAYLKTHMKLHSDEEPFACKLCGARFKLFVYLKWHMAVHKGQYKCNECDACFRIPAELKDHMNSHIGSREFGCTFCSSNFLTKKDLYKHLRKVHRHYQRKRV